VAVRKDFIPEKDAENAVENLRLDKRCTERPAGDVPPFAAADRPGCRVAAGTGGIAGCEDDPIAGAVCVPGHRPFPRQRAAAAFPWRL